MRRDEPNRKSNKTTKQMKFPVFLDRTAPLEEKKGDRNASKSAALHHSSACCRADSLADRGAVCGKIKSSGRSNTTAFKVQRRIKLIEL